MGTSIVQQKSGKRKRETLALGYGASLGGSGRLRKAMVLNVAAV